MYQFTVENEQPAEEKSISSCVAPARAQRRVRTGLRACASEQSLKSWTPFNSAHHRSMTGAAKDDRDTGL